MVLEIFLLIFAFILFCPKKSRKVKLVLIQGGKSIFDTKEGLTFNYG
jgi:hypothetical protein